MSIKRVIRMAGKSGLPAGKGIFSPACVLLTFLLVVSACWASVLAMPGIAQAASTADAPLDNAYVPNGQVDAVVHSGGLTYIGGEFTTVAPYMGSGIPIDSLTGQAAATFPRANGQIMAVAADTHGGEYIGGKFTRVGGLTRNNVAHILSNGTVDPSWNPNANDSVLALAVSGSHVYAGGNFTTLQGASGGPYARFCLADIDASSGDPTSWNPYPSSEVLALAVSGTTVYAGGYFNAFYYGGATTPRNHIAAIDATTGKPTSWNPNAGGFVYTLALNGSTVYAGGDFLSLQGTSGGPYTRNHIAAINATSGNPTSWNPDAEAAVYALVFSNNTVYAGGEFLTFQGASGGPYNRQCLAAIDATTANPTSWNPGPNDSVYALAVSGSNIYVGGDFTSMQGNSGGPYTRNQLAAIDSTTGNPTAWDPNASGTVSALAVSGQNVYAGGLVSAVGGAPRNHIAALDASGKLTNWNPNVNGEVETLAISGSAVYAGGFFSSIQGASGGPYARNNIAAISAATGNPTTWNPDVSGGDVKTVVVAGSTVYAGGSFSSIQGASGGPYARNELAAIDASGNATSWRPGADNMVFTLAVSGSTVFAGGYFMNITGTTGGSKIRHYIAAIDRTSGNPTSWDPEANGPVAALAVSGSTVYAGGQFTRFQGVTVRDYIAAIDAGTGNPTAWNPNIGNPVSALAVSGSGSTVYAGGFFSSIQGASGGPYARNNIAAIGATTGNPTSWNPNADSAVLALAVSGSTVYTGGDLMSIGGDARAHFAIFQGPAPTVTAITPNNAPTGGRVSITNLAGTGFVPGATVSLKRSGHSDIPASSVKVVSPTRITCGFDLAGATPGAWDIHVQSPDGQGVTLYRGFSVSSLFYFAEGTCRPGFDPYFCIQNPGSAAADVTLTYMKGDNTVARDNVTVPPNSRATVSPRTKLGTGNDASHDFSTTVACTNGKQIIAERPMYFNYNGVWTGGHDVVGFTP